jgi:hypothetical protein
MTMKALPARMFGRAADGLARFFGEPARPHPLAFFRVGVALLGVTQVLVLWPYLLQLYGNFGFIQWAVVEAESEVWLPSIGKLCLALQPYGVSSAASVYGVFTLYLLALAGLLAGWRTRLCGVGAWLLHSLTVNSGLGSLYGMDTMLHICLFYCAWMPVGDAFSLDARRGRRSPAPSFAANLGKRALQLHLCLIYLNTGLAKAGGEQWYNGEAIWRAVMQPQFAVFDMSWLADAPRLAMLAAWATLAVELGYPLLIWPRRTRALWVASTVGLHLGIGLLMGLWLFSLMMVVMNFAAFGFELLPRPAPREAAAPDPPLAAASALG